MGPPASVDDEPSGSVEAAEARSVLEGEAEEEFVAEGAAQPAMMLMQRINTQIFVTNLFMLYSPIIFISFIM